MRTTCKVVLVSLGLLVTFFLSSSSAETCFTATIDGAQAGTGSSGVGTGLFVLNDAGTELSYHITFSGLGSAETASHIHNENEGGGIVKNLGTGSPKIGLWTTTDPTALTPARVADLLAGKMYVNVHSANFPGGEIRGQILAGPCNETCFDATIDGAQAGTASLGTGTASMTLNHLQTELAYNVVFSGLGSAETASHIHNDNEGGGIVKNLGTGSPKIGLWTTTDPTALTPARVADLLAGAMYVNVHSVNFPGGEIRGQLLVGNCAPTAVGPQRPARVNSLAQNYPNPFNPSTTIQFTLTEPSTVNLGVYDVSGRLVATLLGEVRGAGTWTATWDGTDRAGNASASGVYFYRIVANTFSETRKMVLLK